MEEVRAKKISRRGKESAGKRRKNESEDWKVVGLVEKKETSRVGSHLKKQGIENYRISCMWGRR